MHSQLFIDAAYLGDELLMDNFPDDFLYDSRDTDEVVTSEFRAIIRRLMQTRCDVDFELLYGNIYVPYGNFDLEIAYNKIAEDTVCFLSFEVEV